MPTFKKQVMSNKPTVTPTTPKTKATAKKNEEKKPMTPEQLSVYCKSKECPWLRNVNYGNGVHSPHCVLRGNEVRPHDKCRSVKDFVKWVERMNGKGKVIIEHVAVEDENDDQ